MSIIVSIGKLILQIFYCVLKLFPTKENKVLFLSRQSNQLSLDFSMLKEELLKERQDIKIVAICNRLADGKDGVLGFAMDTIRSMYHLATSKVCVLDAYWPAVSILHHKKSLTVIQMWHALGKIKQSGYQTLDKESGRSAKTARLLKMHENYDIIVAGGQAWNPFYCKSFNTSEDKLVNIGLPRIDYLIETEKDNRERVLSAYPEFGKKKILLYAPTFRRNIELNWQGFVDSINYDKYIVIIKGHPNQQITCEKPGVYLCPEYRSVELLSVCDYLITDYSAIAIEGAILNKKTYYYVYDYEEYTSKNGLNIDLFETMPGCVFRDGKELAEAIDAEGYNQDILDNYRAKYLPASLGTSTSSLAAIVIDKLTERKE